jgi:DNA adenine methylase
MILRRLGNKKKLMPKLIQYFPPHKIWIEPFFGSGSAFFYKPKAKYSIVNDLDSDVYNLFIVVMERKKELEEAFYLMPIHSDLLNYWKKNKETDPIKKALRFLFLSYHGYMGKDTTLRYGLSNNNDMFYNNIEKTFELLQGVIFNNTDFRLFFKNLIFNKRDINFESSFFYNDPPYISTASNYENQSWTKKDFTDLLDANIATGCKFAVSEFDNPFVIEQAKARNLNVHIIGERQNLKNRRTEILITNYIKDKTLF